MIAGVLAELARRTRPQFTNGIDDERGPAEPAYDLAGRRADRHDPGGFSASVRTGARSARTRHDQDPRRRGEPRRPGRLRRLREIGSQTVSHPPLRAKRSARVPGAAGRRPAVVHFGLLDRVDVLGLAAAGSDAANSLAAARDGLDALPRPVQEKIWPMDRGVRIDEPPNRPRGSWPAGTTVCNLLAISERRCSAEAIVKIEVGHRQDLRRGTGVDVIWRAAVDRGGRPAPHGSMYRAGDVGRELPDRARGATSRRTVTLRRRRAAATTPVSALPVDGPTRRHDGV